MSYFFLLQTRTLNKTLYKIQNGKITNKGHTYIVAQQTQKRHYSKTTMTISWKHYGQNLAKVTLLLW